MTIQNNTITMTAEEYRLETARWNEEHAYNAELQYDVYEIECLEGDVTITENDLGIDEDDDFLMFPEHFYILTK